MRALGRSQVTGIKCAKTPCPCSDVRTVIETSRTPPPIARTSRREAGRVGVPFLPVKIENNRRVRIKVKLQVEDGQVLEESAVEYHHGAGKMLEGLEDELKGMAVGDKKSGVIPAAKAFGGASHQHKKIIPRDEFPKDTELAPGATFKAGAGEGQEVVIEVIEIGETEIHAVLKHALADKNILFDVEVLSVRDPAAAPPPMPADAIASDDDES